MSSLTKHLTTPSPHGHLPFDPRCSLCCEERLHGTIPTGPIVPARVKASLATALVTVSAAGTPAASMAQEIDQEVEGIELPGSGRGGESDLGSEAQVPGDESLPAPGSPGGDEDDDSEGPALEAEPEIDPVRPPGREEPQDPRPGGQGVPAPPAQEGPATSPETAPDRRADAPNRRTSGGSRKDKRAPEPAEAKSERERQRTPEQARSEEQAPDERATSYAEQGPSPGALQPPRSLDNTATPGAQSTSRPIGSEPTEVGREHVVRPGESLWSIAAAMAGRDASPAEIARIVNRLWTLNADRIGTGDPDLVMAGTTLRLP